LQNSISQINTRSQSDNLHYRNDTKPKEQPYFHTYNSDIFSNQIRSIAEQPSNEICQKSIRSRSHTIATGVAPLTLNNQIEKMIHAMSLFPDIGDGDISPFRDIQDNEESIISVNSHVT
jgi:hypothetical protein